MIIFPLDIWICFLSWSFSPLLLYNNLPKALLLSFHSPQQHKSVTSSLTVNLNFSVWLPTFSIMLSQYHLSLTSYHSHTLPPFWPFSMSVSFALFVYLSFYNHVGSKAGMIFSPPLQIPQRPDQTPLQFFWITWTLTWNFSVRSADSADWIKIHLQGNPFWSNKTSELRAANMVNPFW